MRKAFVIARREYAAMVGAKAFVISVALMPVLMLGGAFVPQLLRNQVDVVKTYCRPRPSQLCINHSNSRDAHNNIAIPTRKRKTDRSGYKYELGKASDGPIDDNLRLAVVDRIREGNSTRSSKFQQTCSRRQTMANPHHRAFYAENTALSDVKRWFGNTLSSIVEAQRCSGRHRSRQCSVRRSPDGRTGPVSSRLRTVAIKKAKSGRKY